MIAIIVRVCFLICLSRFLLSHFIIVIQSENICRKSKCLQYAFYLFRLCSAIAIELGSHRIVPLCTCLHQIHIHSAHTFICLSSLTASCEQAFNFDGKSVPLISSFKESKYQKAFSCNEFRFILQTYSDQPLR